MELVFEEWTIDGKAAVHKQHTGVRLAVRGRARPSSVLLRVASSSDRRSFILYSFTLTKECSKAVISAI